MIKIEAAQRLATQYPKYVKHRGRILILGFGGVGQTMLPILLRHFDCDPEKIKIIEKDDHQELFDEKYGNTGVEYEILEVTRQNIDDTLASCLSDGDILINLSIDVDGIELVLWCLDHDVMYIDTSIERWPDESDETLPKLADRTLYHTHQQIREATKRYVKGSTCVVTHGANPGLVTHFVKAAMLDLCKALNKPTNKPTDKEGWAQLAKALDIKVIHVSERDTQILDKPKLKGEFVNTWSCKGFWEEGRAPAELGWGTHEAELPTNAFTHESGPKNSIYLGQPSVSVLLKSWVPKGGAFNGLCIQHSESITISEYLTTKDGSYRPSVYYVYCPCDAALVSVHEFRGHELRIQDKCRVAKTEIVSGIDELGVFLLGHELNAWWYGSQLGKKGAEKLLPGEGATTIQVVASMMGALVWMINNPTEGYCEPEDLPFDYVLKYARPYLGPMASVKSDWTPQADRNSLFKTKEDETSPWSFRNFQISS